MLKNKLDKQENFRYSSLCFLIYEYVDVANLNLFSKKLFYDRYFNSKTESDYC